MSDIQRLAGADEFYFPAVYDFLFLEHYCHDAKTLRINAAIEFPIIRGGIHVDTIVDTIPFPDVLHFIQTSHAFAEKALKFLVCLQDPTMVLEDIRPFGHDLGALIAHYRTIEPELFRRLESGGLADTLDAIANIDFVRLRYLEAHRATSEVNWTKLSRLNRELMEQVKAKRFTYYYSNEETRRRISETTARISIRCPLLEEPWPTISAPSMHRLRSRSDLAPHETATIDGAYRKVGPTFQIREDLSIEQRSAVFQILRRAGMVSPDLSTVSIEILPPHGRDSIRGDGSARVPRDLRGNAPGPGSL
jgi:hypothetical protein